MNTRLGGFVPKHLQARQSNNNYQELTPYAPNVIIWIHVIQQDMLKCPYKLWCCEEIQL